MDQKTRANSFTTFQTPTAVTCQILTSQTTSAVITPSSSNYVQLSPGNLRPITNYTLITGPQVPVPQQYVVQSNARTTGPQYVNASNVRHVLSPSTQQTNVTYMLPSGAHIVRMNNVTTNTMATESKQNPQFILTSSAHKSNPVSTAADNNFAGSSGMVPRTVGTTSTTPILQRSGINIPKLNPRIALRPKLNEQKTGTSYILAPNDWNRTKSVPISSLQKINTNFMQIPFIQKSGAVISTNTLRSNVDNQHQKSQHQPVRSVIIPSSFRNATVSSQQSTDCKLVLNSGNVPTQVLNSNDNRPASNIQSLNTNYMQIPMSQKPGTILTRGNLQPNFENNIRIGQQHPTIRSLIIPPGYRPVVSSPRRGVDYRLILKPVNTQLQVLKSLPSPRYPSPRNSPGRMVSPRQISQTVRPNPRPTRFPLPRPSVSTIQSEVFANSDIKPIPLRDRTSQLLISQKSVEICVDEINKKKRTADNPPLILTEGALELIQAEVTFKLFYLLRECKKVLLRSRSNVLTEDNVRQVCSEYFDTFYGNKLWPLFCLKPDDDDDGNKDHNIWMRKHNNVNLLGWMKHAKFRNPSYIQKRYTTECLSFKLRLLAKQQTSEVIYETMSPTLIKESGLITKSIFQSLKKNQVPLDSNTLPKDKGSNEMSTLTNMDLDIPQANRIPSILLHPNK